MQLKPALTLFAIIATAVGIPSSPAPYLITEAQFQAWLATTDANITYVGKALSARSAEDTTVTYCNFRSGNVCGGTCTVHTGNAACLDAPGTQCLAATTDVSFCDHGGCSGSCNQYASCGTRLDNGFCFTPGTNSIAIPAT